MNLPQKNKIPPVAPVQRTWRARSGRWLFDIGLVVAVYAAVQVYQTRDATKGVAPPVVGLLLSGETAVLGASQGKPTLVHFWATWCSVCKIERSNIEAIARDYSIVTVASQSGTSAEVAQYVQTHAIRAPVLVDEDGAVAAQFGVRAFPTSFIIDSAGQIRDVEVGYTTEWGLRLRLWWASI